MSIYKIPLPLNILEAARERITWTLNTLPRAERSPHNFPKA